MEEGDAVAAPSPSATTVSAPAGPGRRGVLAWLVVALLIGVAGGFLLGRVTMTRTALASDLAEEETVTLMNDVVTAINGGDAAALEGMFTEDAQLSNTTTSVGGTGLVEGNTEIAAALASWGYVGIKISDQGTTIQHGDYAAQFQRWHVDPAITVVRLEGGRIEHMWVVRS